MRRQFVKTVEQLMSQDERLVLLLGDIGVFGFRNVFAKYPERAYNVGICEQAMIGMAAGLAKEGFIPVVHSIAPFVVERCYEQLKVDLCYQNVRVRIVSVGASYDYSALGCTHHCPGDVAVLHALPGMKILLPGTPVEFDRLFRAAYAASQPAYFRLSERGNSQSHPVEPGRAQVAQQGAKATVLAVGPALRWVQEAARDMDVTVLYYTTVAPFDSATLRHNCASGRLLLVEPYYAGVLLSEASRALEPKAVRIRTLGVPRSFLTSYGGLEEQEQAMGLTAGCVRQAIKELIDE